MRRVLTSPKRLRGTIAVPGDKSISHRAALFGALASGTTIARRFLNAVDCRSTLACSRRSASSRRSLKSRRASSRSQCEGAACAGCGNRCDVLDARDSGTTMRLLSGILAGQPFLSIMSGDASLRGRPVDRVVKPLR